jgi:ABC-2 type transport system ATP-binding protein
MENVLEVKSLRKNYKGFSLKDLSFAIPKGYVTGLIGPNGAGKTTIIKLIMNLIRKDGGSIQVFGMDNLEHEIEIKSRIGFVYDTHYFYEDMSLNAIKSAIGPFYSTWDEKTYASLIERFELPSRKKFKSLSKGMKMKFAIALALSHDADFIIMDEATLGLDPVFRREFLEMLSQIIQDENKSVLFSTHITSDLERIADYIVFAQDGSIIFSTSKDELLENWGMVRAREDFRHPENATIFKGFRRREHVFEGLTCDVSAARRTLGSDSVIDKASLEDIMFFISKGNGNV